MKIYADTSFFVSLYLSDVHSARAREALGEKPDLWITQLHEAEWAHAVAQHRYRGLISEFEYLEVKANFGQDLASGLWVRVGLPATTFKDSAALAHKHVVRFGGRTLDSLHVAAAVALGADRFWTFDRRQARLAEAEGLGTGEPT